jgi:Uma2 family endonuclease
MVEAMGRPLTLQEFLSLAQEEKHLELVDGKAVPKMAPKYFHVTVQRVLERVLEEWGSGRGRAEREWAVILRRNDQDWVPVPDLCYVSFERLPEEWMENVACPVAPELVVEVVSPGQSFGALTAKAADYLLAGVLRVWLVDPQGRSFTVFYPDRPPITLTGEQALTDALLPGLTLTPMQLFQRAKLPQV